MALVKCFERYYKKKKQTTTHQFNCSIAYGINDGLFSIFYRLRKAQIWTSLCSLGCDSQMCLHWGCACPCWAGCAGGCTPGAYRAWQNCTCLPKVVKRCKKSAQRELSCGFFADVRELWGKSRTCEGVRLGKTGVGLVRTGIEMENNPWQ